MARRKIQKLDTIARHKVRTKRRPKARTPITPNYADFSQGGTAKCPALGKKKCVAQLKFERGKKHVMIRFCGKDGGDGVPIRVKTVAEALKLTSSMCDCIAETGSAKRCGTKIKR